MFTRLARECEGFWQREGMRAVSLSLLVRLGLSDVAAAREVSEVEQTAPRLGGEVWGGRWSGRLASSLLKLLVLCWRLLVSKGMYHYWKYVLQGT